MKTTTLKAFPFYSILASIIFLINCISLPNEHGGNYDPNIADAAYRGDISYIAQQVRYGTSINQRDGFQKKYTALMVASREGDLELATWLVDNGADVNAKTKDGHTALMYAAFNRYPEIVKLLISKGADVNARSTQGHTALTEATMEESKLIINYLNGAGAKQ
jgi:ankyrin repeat protein